MTARACLQMKPLDMTIRFNCQAQGTAVITVRIEFADDTSFKTSNYGGVETTLRYAKRNPEAPNKEL